LQAQDFPNFGEVSAEELQLKECAFDKGANAVVLLNEAFSDHDDEYHLINLSSCTYKNFKRKGV